MNKVTYQIPGISCGHCVRTIEMELSEIEGVINVRADEESRTAVVEFQDPASEEQLIALLQEINYPVKEN